MKIFNVIFTALVLLALTFPAETARAQNIYGWGPSPEASEDPVSDASQGFYDLLEELDCYEEADDDNDGEPDNYDEEKGYYSECDDEDDDDD